MKDTPNRSANSSNKLVYISLGVGVISLVLALIVFVNVFHQKKLVYVELRKVFSEFEMSKTYDQKMKSVSQSRKAILDSLAVNLKAESRMLQTEQVKSGPKLETFLYDKETYIQKQKQFDEDNRAMQETYNGEITKQLNQYIKDYGEKNNYDLILGAEGSGVLMYAKGKLEITDEIIKYVNERYKGAGK